MFRGLFRRALFWAIDFILAAGILRLRRNAQTFVAGVVVPKNFLAQSEVLERIAAGCPEYEGL
jgi:hypothetical protein